MPRSNNSTQHKMKQDQPANTNQIPGPRVTGPRVTPPPQISTTPSTTSYGSGFVDSLVSGFGFGVGNSLVRKVFEPTTPSEPTKPSEPQKTTVPVSQPTLPTSDDIFNKYMECLQRNEPTENCEVLLDIKS